MLKGYAVQQLEFLRKNTLDEIKRGNYKKAMAFATKYGLISGGGYSLIQELRQPAKGEAPDLNPDNLAKTAAMQIGSVLTLSASGTSEYSWDKFMEAPFLAFAEGLIPPLNIPLAFWDDTKSILEGEPPYEVLKNLPVVGKSFFEPLLDDE